MNLSLFLQNNLHVAATDLFKQLGIPLQSNTSEAIDIKRILKTHYKEDEPYTDVQSAYFIGLIDDSIFENNLFAQNGASLDDALAGAERNYFGMMVLYRPP